MSEIFGIEGGGEQAGDANQGGTTPKKPVDGETKKPDYMAGEGPQGRYMQYDNEMGAMMLNLPPRFAKYKADLEEDIMDAFYGSAAGGKEQHQTINQWISTYVFARVLQGLDVPEANGTTYLDNSIVFWGNELGMNHLNYSMPTLLAGSGGGYLNTGRYIDYIDWNRNVRFSQENGMVIEGIPYNRLLNTLLQAFGLQPSDYEAAAGEGYGENRTLGKSSAFAIDYDRSNIGNILPDIRV